MLVKKKLIYIFICAAIIVTAAIAVPLALLLPKDKPLKLETKDYTLTVGQIEKLEFSVSNPYALVTYKISNEEALSIDSSNNMHALKTGLVTVTINAKFKNEKVFATSLITITDVNNPPSKEETTPTKPDDKENQDGESQESGSDNQENENKDTIEKDNQTGSEDKNKGDGNEEQNPSGENQKPNTENDGQHTEDKNQGGEQDNNNPNINNEFYINFTLTANFGCEIRNNKIFVKRNALANFSISIDLSNDYLHDNNFNYEISGKGISKNLDGFGWDIFTDKDIVAKIIIDGKEVDEILIFVED